MEFLKALEEANQLGVTKEDFIRIWELETKLKLNAEESRVLELRLQCGHLPEQGLSVDAAQKIQSSMKDLRQQISELKAGLLMQSKVQLQEITRLLENQATAISAEIKNERIEAFTQRLVNTYGRNHMGNDHNQLGNDFLCTGGLHQQIHQEELVGTSSVLTSSDSENDSGFFPVEDGAVFVVKYVEQIVSSKKVKNSSMYFLSDCPCKVFLSLWFDDKGQINIELEVFSVNNEHLRACRIFNIRGYIQNKNSGSFSLLFEGKSQALRRLQPKKGKKVKTDVCLVTGSGSYNDITFNDLEKRGFVINGSLIIKWYLTSQEALIEA